MGTVRPFAAHRCADALGDVDAAEHADALRLEVDIADAQREKFAKPTSGEGRGEVDRPILLRRDHGVCGERLDARRILRRADKRVHLLGRVEVELLRVVAEPDSRHVACRVRLSELVRLPCLLGDTADDGDKLCRCPRRDALLLVG
jgi:hypothetical protein